MDSKRVEEINSSNVDEYIGIKVIAFLDNLSYGYVDMIDEMGRLYRAEKLPEKDRIRLLPILKEEPIQDDQESDTVKFMNGWCYENYRYGSQAPVMYFWHSPEVTEMLNKYWNHYYDHCLKHNGDCPYPEDIIYAVSCCLEKANKARLKRLEKERDNKILYSKDGNIVVVKKAQTLRSLTRLFPGCMICDVSSTSTDEEFAKFSISYPHGGIPVPGSNLLMKSIRGIMNRSSVLSISGDGKNRVDTLIGYKYGDEMISPTEGRKRILIQAYTWMLENRLKEDCLRLKQISKTKKVVLIDDEVNDDIMDLSCPLSTASIIMKFIEDIPSKEM